MEGKRISHYEVLEHLGRGGMGVVHKALDTKLGRHVALKFLPREMTRDEEARFRFMQEARAASALDHPNICTIYEIDSTDDEQMFIAMAFYDGDTLRTKLDGGALPVEEALDITGQIARGLGKAHDAGIVHRDIKPANVIVTKDGLAKILDFGIAKLLGVTGPTRDGSTLGTVSYMSPEQVDGKDADPRSDVWALGAVLYQTLTGETPFKGENQWAVMNAIANKEPEPVGALRPEVPAEGQRVVAEALEKDREARLPSAHLFAEGLERALAARAASVAGERRPPNPSRVGVPRWAIAGGASVLAALGVWLGSSLSRGAERERARLEGLRELIALVERGDFAAASSLGLELQQVIPDDPVLAEALATATLTTTIATDPPGADVYIRPYDSNADWEVVGASPADVRWPRLVPVQLRTEADGYETRTLASGAPGFYFGRGVPEVIALSEEGSVPDDMVYVPGGSFRTRIAGFPADPTSLDAYLLDRNEVTNAEFEEFVDAGGYERPEFWEGLEFVMDGRTLSWPEAMAEMVDATGRPGPMTWEFGTFPDGGAAHPVGGVSWYEASAYLRYRGKSLPTIHHWTRAAIEPHADFQGFATAMLPLANFLTDGPRAVGTSNAMGPNGTFDMAGNVREWVLNASGDERWLLGGGWSDDPYMFTTRNTSPPFERAPHNGIRGALYPNGAPGEALTAPVESYTPDIRRATPAGDDQFESYREQLRYLPAPLTAGVDSVDASHPDWRYERVGIASGDDAERFHLHLFIPDERFASPPYETLVYFPGIGGFQGRSDLDAPAMVEGNTFLEGDLVRSGLALAWPVWSGSFERWDDFLSRSGPQGARGIGEHVRDWAGELGRTVDYLETRSDFDVDRVGYYGVSLGASLPLPLLQLEERLRAALLYVGGYTNIATPPAADFAHYAPRTTTPVLMIGGSTDFLYRVDLAQQPLLERLGTPPDDKRHIIYDIGHQPPPRAPFLRDVIPWLREYLGPV